MSTEQIDPLLQNAQPDLSIEDPLEELARIVSGEELEEVSTSAPDVAAVSGGEEELSLEAHLMSELAGEQQSEVADVGADDALTSEIQQQLEAQIAANEPEVQGTAETTLAEIDAVQPSLPAADDETAFQDDLIDALQEELDPVAPQAATPVYPDEMPVDLPPVLPTSEPQVPMVEEPIVEQVQPEPELTNSEIDFGSAFAEELGVETVDEMPEWQQPVTEQPVDEFAMAAQSAGYQPVEEPVNFDAEYQQPEDPEFAAFNAEQSENASGGSKKYAIAALAIALVAGAATAGYGFFGGSGETNLAQESLIIQADGTPVKVKPENPGGRVPENLDKASYGKVEGIEEDDGQTALLSNEEQPALIDQSNASQDAINQAELSRAATAGNNKSDDRLQGGGAENANAIAGSSVTPRRVQTLIIKPDGTIVDQPASSSSQNFTTSSNQLGLTRVASATPRQVSTTAVKPSEPIDGAQSSQQIGVPNASPVPKPKQVAKVQAPKPKPVKVATRTNTTPARSEWVVQVASQTSAEAAQASFRKMRQQYSALQNRSMSVQRAAVNGKTYYRVRVQTASKTDASKLCSRLTSQGGSCFVTR